MSINIQDNENDQILDEEFDEQIKETPLNLKNFTNSDEINTDINLNTLYDKIKKMPHNEMINLMANLTKTKNISDDINNQNKNQNKDRLKNKLNELKMKRSSKNVLNQYFNKIQSDDIQNNNQSDDIQNNNQSDDIQNNNQSDDIQNNNQSDDIQKQIKLIETNTFLINNIMLSKNQKKKLIKKNKKLIQNIN